MAPGRDQLSTTFDELLLDEFRRACNDDNHELSWVLENLVRDYLTGRKARFAKEGHMLAAEGKPKGHSKTKD